MSTKSGSRGGPSLPMRLLGARERGAAWLFALALLAYCVPAYTLQYRTCQHFAPRQRKLNDQVTQGTAPAPYQYQMYLVSPILKSTATAVASLGNALTPGRPPMNPDAAFSLTYWLFYQLGMLLFLSAFFRLCAQVSSETAGAIACILLVAIWPLFIYDSYFHPGDPYGCLFTALIVSRLLRRGPDAIYFILLLLSGIWWEKHVLIPLSVAIAGLLERKPVPPLILTMVAATVVAGVGPVLPRLLYSRDREWQGAALAENLIGAPEYFIWVAIAFGVVLYRMLRRGGSVPALFRGFAAQFIIWAPLYLVMGGVLREMRGVLVMVPLTWPVLAMSIQDHLARPKK